MIKTKFWSFFSDKIKKHNKKNESNLVSPDTSHQTTLAIKAPSSRKQKSAKKGKIRLEERMSIDSEGNVTWTSTARRRSRLGKLNFRVMQSY